MSAQDERGHYYEQYGPDDHYVDDREPDPDLEYERRRDERLTDIGHRGLAVRTFCYCGAVATKRLLNGGSLFYTWPMYRCAPHAELFMAETLLPLNYLVEDLVPPQSETGV